MKKTVYVDMDDVLVDFQSGLDLQPEDIKKEYEGRFDEIPGLFAEMKPMPGAIEAMHTLQEHFDLYILSTAPWKKPSAWSDKVKWVTRYLDSHIRRSNGEPKVTYPTKDVALKAAVLSP